MEEKRQIFLKNPGFIRIHCLTVLQFIHDSQELFYIYRVHCVGIQVLHIADTMEHLDTGDKESVDLVFLGVGLHKHAKQ